MEKFKKREKTDSRYSAGNSTKTEKNHQEKEESH